jgi:tetratricopeptide (TPR) repeat protein
MRAMRKQVQARLFDQIVQHILPIQSDTDGKAAYLLIHFFSGRSELPTFSNMLDVTPEATQKAREVFEKATSGPSPSDEFELTAVYNCCLEIANEAAEGHYAEALILANHGVKFWPLHAELWRQRGVLRLTQGDYDGALTDLHHAQTMKPEMYWLREPIKFAQERRVHSGSGESSPLGVRTVASPEDSKSEQNAKAEPAKPSLGRDYLKGTTTVPMSRVQAYLDFLIDEGYRGKHTDGPDDDGVSTIEFKSEGEEYILNAYETDLKYFHLAYVLGSAKPAELQKALATCSKVNSVWKGTKTFVYENGLAVAQVSNLLAHEDDFKLIFPRALDQLKTTAQDWYEKFNA